MLHSFISFGWFGNWRSAFTTSAHVFLDLYNFLTIQSSGISLPVYYHPYGNIKSLYQCSWFSYSLHLIAFCPSIRFRPHVLSLSYTITFSKEHTLFLFNLHISSALNNLCCHHATSKFICNQCIICLFFIKLMILNMNNSKNKHSVWWSSISY